MSIPSWFTFEIKPLDEKYRKFANIFIILFSLSYAMIFLGLMHQVAYLGPGLGDWFNLEPISNVFQQLSYTASRESNYWPVILFSLLVICNVVATAGILMWGYFAYPLMEHKKFPLEQLLTHFGLSIINAVLIGLTFLCFAVFSVLIGHSWQSGWGWIHQMQSNLHAWTQSLPSLLNLPPFFAFVMVVMIGGFFHYWAHRFSHESRLFWLLFHRTHHMQPELIQPTAQAVFFAFPLFIIVSIPYILIFGSLAKLLTSQSILIYLISYKLLSAFADMFSHQTALYEFASRNPLIRLLSVLTSQGVHHYLHHSAEPQHNRSRGNLCNIGGGFCFFWDRVFGTYTPLTATKPKAGLYASPQLYLNPIRLALAGLAQLIYEWQHNRSPSDRRKIIFGSSDYHPANTLDYAIKPSAS